MNARTRRIVATYEIVIGLVAFVAAAVSLRDLGWLQVTIAIIGGAVSLIAGLLLWQGRSFSHGLSLFVQALQVPRISIGGVVMYGVHLGAAITRIPALRLHHFGTRSTLIFALEARSAGFISARTY
jgi:hypothetical protein